MRTYLRTIKYNGKTKSVPVPTSTTAFTVGSVANWVSCGYYIHEYLKMKRNCLVLTLVP